MDFATSLQAVALRISRVGADGGPISGAKTSFVTDAFTRVAFTPEYTAGAEFTQPNAAGVNCVDYKADDTMKRVNLEVAICAPVPDLYQLLGGGTVLAERATRTVTNKAISSNVATLTTGSPHGFSAGNTVNVSGVDSTFDGTYTILAAPSTTTFTYAKEAANVTATAVSGGNATASSQVGDEALGWASAKSGEALSEDSSLAIEVWSRAIVGGRPATVRPFFHWLYPYSKLRMEGERALENGLMANVFSGHSVGNSDWYPGVGTPEPGLTSDSPVQFVRTNTAPTGVNGWVTVP